MEKKIKEVQNYFADKIAGCPYCGKDELKHHAKGFYCCYNCGKIVNPYLLNEYTRLKFKHYAI